MYAPLGVWIAVILFAATGQGAMSETSRFIRPILEFLFPTASPDLITLYHGVIRKTAHFTVYAILGILACRALLASNTFSRNAPFIFALVLVIFVAIVDEAIQSFYPERTGSIWDVLLDFVGGVFAVVLFRLTGVRPSIREASSLDS